MMKTQRVGGHDPAGRFGDPRFLRVKPGPVFGINIPARRRVAGGTADFQVCAVRVLREQAARKPKDKDYR